MQAVATRANGQPAFGCYLPDPHAAIARPWGFLVLTLDAHAITAITWFSELSLFARFGLPRSLPHP
jgi:RNA polymerase sigma-70 factor, ECF subfamily